MLNYAGQVLKSYELKELIDTGGFGAIYRANQTVVEREVAIKIIFPDFASRPNFIRRFEAEAQLVAGLEHPYIVPLYDYWRDPDGAYIVMRWLRGGHLRTMMRGTPMSIADVARVVDQIGTALIFAHRYGVVHRDLKPENILLDEAGNAYLADFGIAQIMSSSRADDEMGSMGSPAYAAPEQMTGMETTPFTDQYSLSVILYEMLAGQHPFPDLAELTLTELTTRRISEPLPPLSLVRPDLPPAVGQVIQRATALNPNDRYEDVATMLATFETAIDPLVIGARASRISAAMTRTQQIAALTVDLPNPYKGLRTFQESDAANFFGRQALVDRLVSRMREGGTYYSRFLAVVGPSGSGKSSVVKAGLVPALRAGALPNSSRWYYVELTPGAQPFKEVEAALTSIAVQPPDNLDEMLKRDPRLFVSTVQELLPPDQTTELFLLIDQFEELFTQVDDDERDRFVQMMHEALTNPASRVCIVVTLRADFYDRPLLLPLISEMMRQRTEVIVPLTPSELDDAIVEPARRLGVSLESGLDTAIIQEVTDHPGALPLLQYLMSEMFTRRQGMWMTMAAYQQMGGVRGALAKRAEEIYESLPLVQRTAMAQLMLRLITLGEGTEDTRRRTLISEVNNLGNDPTAMLSVIDTLGKARLITFDRDPETRSPTVEVTHEAIIREWARLRSWLETSRNDVRLQRTLAALATEWVNAQRDPSYVLRDARLRQFETWSSESTVALTPVEAEFLAASLQEQSKRQTMELQRAENERKLEKQARNRLSILVGVMALALLFGIVLTGYALTESQRAQAESQRAQAESEIAQSLAQAAGAGRALSEGDADLAVVLALAANSGENIASQAVRTLTEVAFSPGTRQLLSGHTSDVKAVAIDPLGRFAASGSRDSSVRLWPLNGQGEARVLTGHRGDVEAVQFSPNGQYVASGGLDLLAILWDVETGEQLAMFEGHTGVILALAFSPDSTRLLTASRDNTLILWDVASRTRLLTFEGHDATVQAVAFSPDGRTIASGAGNGDMILWDAETGEPLREWSSGSTGVNEIAFLNGGDVLLSAQADKTLVLWGAENGEQQNLFGLEQIPLSAVPVPGANTVLVGLSTGEVAFVDLATGQTNLVLRAHSSEVYGVDVSADGRTGVTGSGDGTVRLWNVTNPAEVARFNDHAARITGLALVDTGAGVQVVSSAADQTVRIRPLGAPSSAETAVVRFETQVRAMAVNPANGRAYVGTADGLVNVLRVADATVENIFPIHESPVLALASQGDLAASIAQGEGLRIWDRNTGVVLQTMDGYGGAVLDLAFDATASRLAFGQDDFSVVIWDVVNEREERRLTGSDSGIASVAFFNAGTRVAAGTRDGRVLVWDAATGEIIYRLFGHSRDVWSLAFSADDARMISAGGDGLVIWWDVASGEVIERFNSAVVPALKVAISPDQNVMASGADRGVVQLWRLYEGPSLIDWTRDNRYVRDLTCQERALYRVLPLCEAPGSTG